ncbi:MAG TPA: tetratricopeptide repeat protein [Terriglobales bacterium]|nr:tetratricopeptide repeat protein [Terriglobales bacterium]
MPASMPLRPPAKLGAAMLVILLVLLTGLPGMAADSSSDWSSQVRLAVKAGELDQALALAEARIAAAPSDLEAHGWRARLLAWKNRHAEAEAEYRFVLAQKPNDLDMLLGLSDVLHWDGKDAEALRVLDQAQSFAPQDAGVLVRRGRVLAALKRNAEARSSFRQALIVNREDESARLGLQSLAGQSRHEVRVGTDVDGFNYTGAAALESMSLASRWNSSWTTNFAFDVYQRFGQRAGKFTGAVTRNLTANNWLTAGGAAGQDHGIIPKSEALFGYGHGVRLNNSFFRGLETSYDQHWYWYSTARILTVGGTALVYLPRDWTWLLSINAARSAFSGLPGHEWTPNGRTRLGFPLMRRLSGNLMFAVGSETFAEIDQTGRFAARTFGGGLRFSLTDAQDISGYIAAQDRSQGRSQTSGGVSYGFRF